MRSSRRARIYVTTLVDSSWVGQPVQADIYKRSMSGQSAPSVFLHIGAPKTGTTFLQQVLWSNRASLARAGVTLPGSGFSDHFRATQDLRGKAQEARSRTPSWRGEWDALAGQARRARTASAVISCEMLAAAGPKQVRRAVASLAPAEVHVVYTARNLGALLPAAYQEQVKHRSTREFGEWLADVLDADPEGKAGKWFWGVHDPVRVLRRWSEVVPKERIHVVTMPGGGAAPDLLWHRFASVLGLDPGCVDTSTARPNASLGPAEVELLRRVNQALGSSVPLWHYTATVKDQLAHEVLAGRDDGRRLVLPESRRPWVRDRAQRLVAGLRGDGYHLVGDLDDLLPAEGGPVDAEPVDDADLVDAAVEGLAGFVRASLHERTELPAHELLKRAVLDLGSRSRTVRSALGAYRRVSLRLRRS